MWYKIPFLLLICLMISLPVQASNRVHGVRVFLNNGDPDQAILTAQSLLNTLDVSRDERFSLLSLIAYAEEMRAQAKHYEHVKKAIEALKDLEKAFPQRVKKAPLHWRIIWLHWKHGDDKAALRMSSNLRSDYPDRPEAMQAAMLMARIYIQQHKYDEARSNLMRYGLGADKGSREEALTQAWIAVVDVAEKRYSTAVDQLNRVYRHFPDVIKDDERVFSVYIQALDHVGLHTDALAKADVFLSTYLEGDALVKIRLLRADLWVLLKKAPQARIEREYNVLSETQAETSIGKQAFMRKLMLVHAESQTYYALKPVIIALKRIADRNQLSPVENEALYDLGILWERLSQSDPEHAPKQSATAGLDAFARVANSDISDFRKASHRMGTALFNQRLNAAAAENQWEKEVALWERYPRLRENDDVVKERAFDVAHALRMLMDYQQSEALLNKLYKDAGDTVWAQKIMLERANLWMDRGDADGVGRILAWLDAHQYTLYRPEMLLLVAQMQLTEGNATVASQSLVGVSVDDVAKEDRQRYWQINADINEALNHWHVAAKAWRKYGQSEGADVGVALIREADALFRAQSYKAALERYKRVKKEKQDAAWQYHVAMCQLKTGEDAVALPKLEMLTQNKDAGIYASLASMELADRKARDILQARP
ncbi:MAG: hypothetical protein Q9M15_01720 [Mariprofundaceae bacterium]|nr:hypothetical protein [Mariprofundaceae bacterium]